MGAEAGIGNGSARWRHEYIAQYRLLGYLSHGLTGTSYLAITPDAECGEQLVIAKELRVAGGRVTEFAKFCETEARVVGRIEHPNVVRTLGTIQHRGSCYWVTEYLDGQPFSKLVQASRTAPQMSLRMRLHVIRDALSGLHAAHQLRDQRGRCLNVVHAGVRPSNVIVAYDGSVKVVGLGLASALAWSVEKGDIPGRLRYLAPEQLLEQDVDRRADVFSVGVMLWESISLRKFTSSSIRERDVIQRRLTGAEPRIAQVNPQVPLPLARLCDKAMSVDRKQRFASAREFQEALDEYMSSSGAPCKVTSLGQLVAKKFEGERSEVNRLINRGRRGGVEISTAVAMRVPGPLDDDGEPTIVRDSTGLLEHSHITRGPITVLASSHGQWRWLTPRAALLLLLVVVLWFGYRWAKHSEDRDSDSRFSGPVLLEEAGRTHPCAGVNSWQAPRPRCRAQKLHRAESTEAS
jgi:hypothetical protein